MNSEEMEPLDLCVPIYLNQQIVFDLLAILEDGFSTLRTVTSSAIETENRKAEVGASIGATNIFALLGVSLSAKGEQDRGKQGQKQVSEEKVHTPTSLFASLRLSLKQRQMVKQISDQKEFEKLAAGQFVEFRALLKKNPLVDTIEWFKQMAELFGAFEAGENRSADAQRGGSGRRRQPQDTSKLVHKQLDAMLTGLSHLNSLELVGEILGLPDKTCSVLSTKLDYFTDRDASQVIDGEFSVFGKIVRVVASSADPPINLLRKTSFGRLDQSIFDKMAEAFEDMEDLGLERPDTSTTVQGPAIQVVPIAIFT